jgi:hypothetical protein
MPDMASGNIDPHPARIRRLRDARNIPPKDFGVADGGLARTRHPQCCLLAARCRLEWVRGRSIAACGSGKQ